MKPSIENLAKLLIGKSAVSSLYVTEVNKEKAFEITDVRVNRGLVYVKGKDTPWLTENVIDVLVNIQNALTEEEIKITCSKLKHQGTIKESNFEKIRDEALKSNVYPVGTYFVINTTKASEKNYAFIHFPSGWRIVDEIFYLNELKRDDIFRALEVFNNFHHLPSTYQSRNNNLYDAFLETYVYFCLSSLPISNLEEVLEYIKQECGIKETTAKELVKAFNNGSLEIGDLILFIELIITSIEEHGKKYTLKEMAEILISKGISPNIAKVAARMIPRDKKV